MSKANLGKNLGLAAALIWSISFGSIPAPAQEIISVSSIAEDSSVFVFRQIKAVIPKRFIENNIVRRTKVQRVETARKVTKQVAAIAKTAPRRTRPKLIEPAKLPKNIDKMSARDSSRVFAGLGEYYVTKKDFDKSLEAYREAVRRDAQNKEWQNGLSDALAMKGNALVEQGKEPEAKPFFEEALKINPKNAVAYFGLGDIADEANNLTDAIANYEKALDLDKDLTEIYSPLGVVYYQKGEIAKADDYLSKALLAGQDDFETQYYTGLIRFSQNRNRDALNAFRKAAAFDAKSAETQFYIGESLMRLDRNKDAAAAYAEAIKLKPRYFEAIFSQGVAFYELKNFQEAARSFEEARYLRNDMPEVYVNLGNAYRESKKFTEAEANYYLATVYMQKEAEVDREELAEIHGYIGYVILKQCDINLKKGTPCKWDTALWNFEKAVEIGRTQTDITNLGWAYMNVAKLGANGKKVVSDSKDKLEKAKTAFQRAIEANPKFAEAPQMNLGLVSLELGDYPAAIEALKPIAAKRDDWIYVNYALGVAYRKNEDLRNAIRQFRKVLARDPNYVAAMASLVEAEFRNNNRKEAEKVMEDLKKADSDEAKKLEFLFNSTAILQ